MLGDSQLIKFSESDLSLLASCVWIDRKWDQ